MAKLMAEAEQKAAEATTAELAPESKDEGSDELASDEEYAEEIVEVEVEVEVSEGDEVESEQPGAEAPETKAPEPESDPFDPFAGLTVSSNSGEGSPDLADFFSGLGEGQSTSAVDVAEPTAEDTKKSIDLDDFPDFGF
jgi:hypothetical protein